MMEAAHALDGPANPLLYNPRYPPRTPAGPQTAVEETGDICSAALGSSAPQAELESSNGYEEELSLHLKKFASPVTKDFTRKLHFFQAIEQGIIDRSGASVEDTDMAMIERMGGACPEEPQGELVAPAGLVRSL